MFSFAKRAINKNVNLDIVKMEIGEWRITDILDLSNIKRFSFS